MSNTLKITTSKLTAQFAGNALHQRYEAQLKSLDKNGDGEIDINELFSFIEDVSKMERQRQLLKWAAIITGCFALLTIAAVVGLVYAVVVLTKDTTVQPSGIMTAKDSAATSVATAQITSIDDINTIYNKSLAELSKLSFIVIPNANGGSIIHVAQIDLVANTSATVTTDAGMKYLIDASGIHEIVANGTGGISSRRLFSDHEGVLGFDDQIHPMVCTGQGTDGLGFPILKCK